MRLWIFLLFGACFLPLGESVAQQATKPDSSATPSSVEDAFKADVAPVPQVSASLQPTLEAPSPPPQQTDPLLFESGPLRVKYGLEALSQGAWAVNSWWRLSEQFAPTSPYTPNRFWSEGWFKPSVRTDFVADEWLRGYSGVSMVGSGNLGRDLFDQGYRGLIGVEDAYVGVKFGNPNEQRTLDLSYGRQQYKIGSGMLIGVGANNGFERGATTTFARRAWAEAALAKANLGPVSVDGFYLRPNELRSSDTNNQLAGGKAELAFGANQYAGLAYINVLQSTLPYLGAPVRFFENGRDGLQVIHAYTRTNPLQQALPGLYVAGDFAYEWNDRIDLSAVAYNGEVGHTFAKLPFKPTTAYAFRYFSGDDPSTNRLEKFDPLFYEGSPPLWAAGGNGSFVFINSNILAHRVSLAMTVTPKDYVNLYYWHVRAAQTNSPLQFGGFARVDVSGGEPSLISGVPDAHLADEFYAEYTRMITQNIFVTTGFAVSIPGRGLKAVAPKAQTWFGGLLNIALKY